MPAIPSRSLPATTRKALMNWSAGYCGVGDRRPTFLETIRRVAAELSIPLTAAAAFERLKTDAPWCAPARTVTVNTRLWKARAHFELSREFGAQAVVLAMTQSVPAIIGDACTGRTGIRSPRCIEGARMGVADSAGEILLPRWTADGTQSGFDITLTAAISRAVTSR